MSRKQPAFDDLVDALRREVFGLVADFEIVQQFMMPLMRQQRLVDHYPYLLRLLPHAASTGLTLRLCRLFDPDKEPRRGTLGNLLRRVRDGEGLSKAPLDSESIDAREAFMQAVPDRLVKIPKIYARLEAQRNSALAHLDLTRKGEPATIKWDEVRESIALARAIVEEYQAAFCGIREAFDLQDDLAHEAERFRAWARLDDYERHCAEDRKREGDNNTPEEQP